ncbi:hypothetical protein Tco_1403515 [Tanacetum coccineum]
MNEGVKDSDQKSLKKRVVEETPKKDDTTEIPAKQDVAKQGTKKRKGGHIKMIVRKKPRHKSNVDNEDEHRKCLKIVTFEVMGQYLEITLEGIELILWGDLKIMMESSQEENDQSDFWDDQQDREIVIWRLYKACGVYILELEDGTVIHIIKKDLLDSEKLEATLGDESLAKGSDLKKALEMVALFEAQMKEMNPVQNYQRIRGLNLRQVQLLHQQQKQMLRLF